MDADFLEAELLYAQAEGRAVERGQHMPRAEVLEHAIGKAELLPGLFTLTVSTGSAKTSTLLRLPLERAVRHGLRRVVYVIPYTSIIEQTAEVFRQELRSDKAVLEHHASFDWAAAETGRTDDGGGQDGLAALRGELGCADRRDHSGAVS